MSSMLRNFPLRNGLIGLAAMAMCCHGANARTAPASFALTSEARKQSFSGTILIRDHGRTVFQHSYGLADRSFGVPITQHTRFRIASISKLFTAVLVLKLAEEGRVDLDAPFQKYLPAYPGPDATAVTVRQLLGHMSGLPQFDTVSSLDDAIANGLPQYQRLRTPQQLLALCCSAAPTAAAGRNFDYNNADYIVLGQLIEAVTGQTYTTALSQRLLGPLGLGETGMARWDGPIENLAPTYFRKPGSPAFSNDLPVFWENWYAAGALYSDADDIARFSEALFGGRVLSASSMRALLTPAGDEYGLGLWSYTFKHNGVGYRVAKRPGSIMGANAMLYVLPDREISIVILANSNAMDLDALAQSLAEAMIDGRTVR